MRIIFLAGQSILNKSWIEEVAERFSSDYPSREVLIYDHWTLGESQADVEKESIKLKEIVSESNESYGIFAKSIGTVITLKAIASLDILPEKIMMVGVPINTAIEQGYNYKEFSKYDGVNVTIFQKTDDPYGSLAEVSKIAGENITVNEYNSDEPDDDHHYANVDFLFEMFESIPTV